jgi:mannosyltransferase
MNPKPAVFVTNFNSRFTGVSATTASVYKVQKSQLEVALVGKALSGCPSPLSKRKAIALSLKQPEDKPFNIWHVRRNSEMQLAIFARDILRLPIKIVFTSAAQRRHSAWPRWLISKMDAVIATSKEAASFVPNVVSIIPHGVDLDQFYPSKNQKENWLKTGMPGEYGIISVGRVRPEKGTDLFVEAMIEALPQLPKAIAIIAGATKRKDASFRKKLEARIEEAGLTGRIKFLGEVPSHELPALLKGCRALVALPRYEGFGLTPLEGMACGLPVVASKTGYFEEFLNISDNKKACGKIVPTNDYQTASKEIVALLTNQKLFDKFSSNAINQSKQKYSVLEEATAINKVYEDLWNSKIN